MLAIIHEIIISLASGLSAGIIVIVIVSMLFRPKAEPDDGSFRRHVRGEEAL